MVRAMASGCPFYEWERVDKQSVGAFSFFELFTKQGEAPVRREFRRRSAVRLESGQRLPSPPLTRLGTGGYGTMRVAPFLDTLRSRGIGEVGIQSQELQV